MKDVGEIRELRKNIKALEDKMEDAKRKNKLSEVADIQFGRLLQLQVQLKRKEEEEESKDQSKRTISEIVGPERIVKLIEMKTGKKDVKIPSSPTGDDTTEKGKQKKKDVLELKSRLRARVIGQAKAVDLVSDAVIRSVAGVADEHRPIGSFMFLGQTGVGKTELAKALAADLY